LLCCVLWLAPAVAAQDNRYEELLDEAVQLEHQLWPGETADAPVDRSYRKLAEAARLAPGRWEAFALRGTNRCTMAVVSRDRMRQALNDARARGESDRSLYAREVAGERFIAQCIEEAKQNFGVMHRNMQARGEVDPERLRFATAALSYAKREYLKGEAGGPGAIDGFKSLMRRGWKVDYCSEFIARCYLQLGVKAVMDDKHELAQEHWSEGLRWARHADTKRTLLTSKAAGYDLDNEYGYAEKILRELIEKEPTRPVHWKNLGLMLGHQNKLRAALHAYRQCRFLCSRARTPIPLSYFHGNSWLKAAMIHGKLLEQDGDLLLAWRLFLEYRATHGDNYNFCVNFGEFLFHQGQFDLAWRFLVRARDLQPFCLMPFHLLLQTALRMDGPREEVEQRIEQARKAHREALKRFRPREESARLKRLCAGLRDERGGERLGNPQELLDPDPLAGQGPDAVPPEWIVKAAALREPFRPYDPAIDDQGEPGLPSAEPPPEPAPDRTRLWVWGLTALSLLVIGGAWVLVRRRRVAS
jgi:tetratricopeptide (TPR) repeat protein